MSGTEGFALEIQAIEFSTGIFNVMLDDNYYSSPSFVKVGALTVTGL